MFFIFSNLNKCPVPPYAEGFAPPHKNMDEKLCILSISFWREMWYAYGGVIP